LDASFTPRVTAVPTAVRARWRQLERAPDCSAAGGSTPTVRPGSGWNSW